MDLVPGNVDTARVLEALHGSADGRLKLNDPNTALEGLWVDDDLHVQGVGLDEALDGLQIHPQVVGVEVLELLDRLEIFLVHLRNLGDLEKTKLALVLWSKKMNISEGHGFESTGSLINISKISFKVGVNFVKD